VMRTSCTWCLQATVQIRSQPPRIPFIFTPTFHSHCLSPLTLSLSGSLSSLSLSLSHLCALSIVEKKMLLGKRPRPPIKRTTSMTGITVDPSVFEPQEPSDHQDPIKDHAIAAGPDMNFIPNGGYDQRLSPMVSPRSTQRRNSGDHFTEDTAHFLHTCGLCKRRLPPGRDIYMYRYIYIYIYIYICFSVLKTL
jgi:hypothetical protein